MNEVIQIIFKTLISYLVLISIMRFMGKREIGQLNLFDLVILLSIVDLLVVGIENFKENYFIWLAPVVVLGIIQKLIAILLLKFSNFRALIDGRESLIINQGEIVWENMKKNNYNLDDLYVQIRQTNIRSVDEIEYAVLETNGKLSVFTKEESDGTFPIPLIVSGCINKDALKMINKDKDWLIKKLKEKGYSNHKKVRLVTYKEKDITIL